MNIFVEYALTFTVYILVSSDNDMCMTWVMQMPLVLRRCLLGGKNGIRPVKSEW